MFYFLNVEKCILQQFRSH